MSRYSREDIDRYFDHGIFSPKRIIYMGSTREDLDGSESGVDYSMTEKAIKGITYLNTVSEKPMVIIMNNMGGDWYHSLAIYDIIKSSRCHITIVAVGYCCSAGSVILQAADLRVISPSCIFLIHDGTTELSDHTRNVETQAEQSKLDRKRMYEIYQDKMGKKDPKITIKQIEKLCTIDKIYSPQETIDVGLADELLQDINFYVKE
jgi:ATP-dependent protease ClpP protease subunit